MKNKLKLYISFIFIFILIIFILDTNNSLAVENKEKIVLTSIVKKVSNKVSNTYKYKIEPDSKNEKDGLIETKTFNVNFDNVIPDENMNAIVTYDLDFSNINFTKTGTYKYIVTEENSSNKEVFPISKEKYEIYVQVYYDSSNKLVKNVYTQALNLNTNEKSNLVFEHNSIYTHINIEHYEKGTIADKNEYIKYKFTLLGNPGDKYKIIGQDKIVNYKGEKINTEDFYTIKSGEENYIYLYLKSDQKITVGLLEDGTNQIPIGIKYKIKKVEDRKWKTNVNDNWTDESDYLTTVENPANNFIIIINEKEFDVALTGIFVNILPFIILIVIGILGVILVMKTKKNDDKYDKNTK